LNIQYSKKKEEMRRDPIMDWLISTKASIAGNLKQLAIGGGVVVAAIAVVMVVSYMMNKKRSAAQDVYGKAMIALQKNNTDEAVGFFTDITDKFGSTPHAGYSAFMLGGIYYKQNKYDDAIKWFEIAAAKKKNTAFVPGGALEELAACYEAKGDLTQAQDYLKKALANPESAFRYPSIRWKLALLAVESKKVDDARSYCQNIIADSLAGEFRQKADLLLVELQ
jgi:tetratricopeptide (TPR) repeat protein